MLAAPAKALARTMRQQRPALFSIRQNWQNLPWALIRRQCLA